MNKSLEYDTDEKIDSMIPKITNWSKWGTDDQRGTLNYITQKHKLHASQLIKSGKVISLSRESIIKNSEEINGKKIREYFMTKGDMYCVDFVGLQFHGFSITHIDSLCHIFASREANYNGHKTSDIKDTGANNLDILPLAEQGIVGRGVLLDIAYTKGDILKPGTIIHLEDLLEAEKKQKVKVNSGDILLIRNGRGRENNDSISSGLHPDCIPWIHEKEVSLLGSDGPNDFFPAHFKRWTMPIHQICIPYMGLPLLDNADLDPVSKACQEENRWEFFITISPWKFKGTTGSPVNPLVIF